MKVFYYKGVGSGLFEGDEYIYALSFDNATKEDVANCVPIAANIQSFEKYNNDLEKLFSKR